MFIRYIHLLYLSYMLRRYIRHHKGERLCLILNAMCCYVAITNCCYSSCFANYKRYARIGIVQNPSKYLDVAYWHFLLLNELCPQ